MLQSLQNLTRRQTLANWTMPPWSGTVLSALRTPYRRGNPPCVASCCWLPPWRPPSPSPVRWPPPLPWPRPRSTCRTPPSTGSATRQQVHRDPGRPARALLLRRRRPRLLRLLRAGGRPLPLRGCEPAQARRPDLPAAAGLHHPGAAQVEPNRGPAVLRLRPRRVVSHVELVYRKGGTGPRIAVSASHSGGPPVNFHRIRYQGLVKVGRVVR